jgi:adenine phosphoribosyltransferase
LKDWSRGIVDVPDFPKPGILFKDISPLLADHELFGAAIEEMAQPFRRDGVSKVVGIEARGFMFGAAIALALSAGFVPVRKPGKLPRQTRRLDYALEYGSDSLEIHADAIGKSERCLVADDVLATGGTARAAADLVRRCGGTVVGCSFFLELTFLKGRDRLTNLRVHSVTQA